MVTLDQSITNQLNEMTGRMASGYSIRRFIELRNPESLNLMRQFRDHTQYLEGIGELSNDNRKYLINTTFLDDYLIPGVDKIQEEQATPYFKTLSNILNCIPKKQRQALGLYLFMDMPYLLADKMQPESLELIKGFTEQPCTFSLIATWGFLKDKIDVGSNLNKLIGNGQDFGPLGKEAVYRAREIYNKIKN